MLQNVMNAACLGATCSALKTHSFADVNKCAVSDTVKEPVDGCEFIPPQASKTKVELTFFSCRDHDIS